jgi:hypothetical protein
MNKPADNILFATIDSIPMIDKKQATQEILLLDDSLSFWDEYRYTKMFPLMTKNGGINRTGASNNQDGNFEWTPYAPKVIVDWFEDYVFSWLGSKTRVMALVTQPGVANNEHIDCSLNELNTRQHKFRIVLQGKTDTLYWVTSKGNIPAPDTDKAFIIDGGWPHGMINTTNEIKVTLALGAPWTGKDEYNDLTLLQNRNDYLMPERIDHLWKTER